VLKLTEGIISHLMGWIQERIKVHSADNDVSSIITPVFKDIRNTFDHQEHGATPLLGINGVVMKCHGSSSERGIKNSIIAAQKTVEGKLINGIIDRLSRHSNIFDKDTTISETNPV
jgi:glycerol-3-phosphate acyltransferase PlsX